jgi:hypothetical protein
MLLSLHRAGSHNANAPEITVQITGLESWFGYRITPVGTVYLAGHSAGSELW